MFVVSAGSSHDMSQYRLYCTAGTRTLICDGELLENSFLVFSIFTFKNYEVVLYLKTLGLSSILKKCRSSSVQEEIEVVFHMSSS